MKFDAKKEVAIWEQRIIYDVRFKQNVPNWLERLDQIMFHSMSNFVTIAANSEALVYKITRYYIEEGKLKNSDIEIINGHTVKAYIGDDAQFWKKKQMIDDLFSIYGPKCKNKWVLIPLMDFDMTEELAEYFMTQFIKYEVRGLIVFGDGPENLVEVIGRNYSERNPYFIEFPETKRRISNLMKHKFDNDEY